MNKKFIIILSAVFALSFSFLWNFAYAQGIKQNEDLVYVFWGQGCGHCAKVEQYIQENRLDDIFSIERKEIYFDKENREDFLDACDKNGIPMERAGVPMAIINGKCVRGKTLIIEALEAKAQNIPLEEIEEIQSKNPSESKRLTLPLIIGAALVDAINPCAFAVLVILMTTILASGERKKALLAGLAFALSIYISYLLMGLGIYKALSTAELSGWFMKFVGSLAILVGALNIKDYFWYGKGFLMEVPQSWRPKMKSLIKSITSPVGAFFVGFVISLFLLPCTSGPYIVILGMLSQEKVFMSAFFWLLLYNAIFILPMIIITLAVYKGLSPQKLEKARQKKLRLLHLVAGILMLGIGAYILFDFYIASYIYSIFNILFG